MSYLPYTVTPRWLNEPKDTALMLGNAIVIDCMAEGYPEPEIIWSKGGMYAFVLSPLLL